MPRPLLRSLAATLGLCALSGCAQDKESTAQTLKRQRAKWDEQRPSQYVVQLCRTGLGTGCERVAVDGDTVTVAETRTRRADGGWQPLRDQASHQEPIARLFEDVPAPDDCILKELAFDPEYGFVRKYYHDCDEEGFGVRILCFEEDTLDVTLCDEDY